MYALTRGSSHGAVVAGGNHNVNYRGCVKWKEWKAALAKQAPERRLKSVATGQLLLLKVSGPIPLKMDLVEGWNNVVRGGRVDKATTTLPTNPHHNPLLSRSRRPPRSLY